MGFFFRKSLKFGPIRLNFSKSGIGISSGIKGARISVGPRGTYVHLGRNGFYYRKKIDGFNTKSNQRNSKKRDFNNPLETLKHTIYTKNFDGITDIESQDFIRELQEKYDKISYTKWFGVVPSIVIFILLIIFSFDIVDRKSEYGKFVKIKYPVVNIREHNSPNGKIIYKAKMNEELLFLSETDNNWCRIQLANNKHGYVYSKLIDYKSKILRNQTVTRIESNPLMIVLLLSFSLIFFLIWNYYLFNLDEKRKRIILEYKLDDSFKELYKRFIQAFLEFSKSRVIWQILHQENTYKKKYFGGATQIIQREPIKGISVTNLPFKYLKTNVKVPSIKLINIVLYFLPEMLLLKKSGKFAGIFYKNLLIERNCSNFREYSHIPSDTKILNYAWRFLNKNGEPDLRFKNNFKIPICDYSNYRFFSIDGINEEIMTSKSGAMDNFLNIINTVGKIQKEFESIKNSQNLNQASFANYNGKNNRAISLLEKSDNYLNAGKYNEAIICLKKELENDSNSSECYYKLGHAYLKNKDYKNSIVSFSTAIKTGLSEIKNLGAFTALSSAYLGLGDYDKAIEYLLKVNELIPNNPQIFETLGTLHEAKGDKKKAEEYYHFAKWLSETDKK